jgi:putative FmdB family regulatory protein
VPTYDYVCAACGHAFEHFQEMSAKKLRTCPRCKKPRLERQVGTGAGLIFKGSGFYITDYKRSGGGDGSEKQAEARPAEEKKASGTEPKAAGESAGGSGAKAPAPAAPSPSKTAESTPARKPAKGTSGKPR